MKSPTIKDGRVSLTLKKGKKKNPNHSYRYLEEREYIEKGLEVFKEPHQLDKVVPLREGPETGWSGQGRLRRLSVESEFLTSKMYLYIICIL